MLDLGAKLIVAYLLGSISGSLLLGRFRGVDIRREGSGNAGGTNAFRTQGVLFALGVVIIDIGKGVLASGPVASAQLLGPPAYDPIVISLACGFAAVVGHIWPLYHGFRGGKGAATFIGAVIVRLPWGILPLLAVWLLTLLLTGYVGLATVMTALAVIPVFLWLAPESHFLAYQVFALASAALVIFAHRSNLRRLARGEEHCFEKARLLRARASATDAASATNEKDDDPHA